jgi:large subunit ribosomal protein L17
MRHQRAGKKLGRDAAHRKALYSNLAGALIEHGRIKTTVTKAKAVKPIAEQMITLGRRGDLHARRQATAFLRSRDVVHHLFAEIAPRFKDRPGGYTRIVKLGPRPGDAAEMVYLELVDEATQTRPARQAPPASEAVAAEPEEAQVEAPETEAEAAEDPEAAAEAAEPADLEEPVDATAEAPAGEPPVVEPVLEAEPAGDEPVEPEAAGDEAAGDEPTTEPTA